MLKLDRNTELARAVDIMRARAKRIYILMIEVNKLFFFFFSSRYFPKEIENIFSMFLLSYRNTRDSLGELGKTCGNTRVSARVPTAFETSTRVSITR